MLIGQSSMPDPRASPGGDALLCATGIKKVFGGAVALSHGNLSVCAGEIHALLGENGAGKSTLIKCLAGTPPPDAGEVPRSVEAPCPKATPPGMRRRLALHLSIKKRP